MLLKKLSLKKMMLLVTLVCALVFVSATPMAWAIQTAYAADTMVAQNIPTDRISFYNVPSDRKLEFHLDYANGKSEKVQFPLTQCAAGTVFTRDLNMYSAKFVANGCDPTVFQNLNLRWMGDCQFKLEEDPDVRVIARGPYGEVVVVDEHYAPGTLEIANIPANTTSLSATMVFTNPKGIVQTGNVELTFHTPHPGCGPAATATPTQTVTAPAPTETPTPVVTQTPVATSTATATPTVTQTPVATNTATATATPTEENPNGSAPTPTPTTTVEAPTGLDPVGEPSASQPSMVYLPLVTK